MLVLIERHCHGFLSGKVRGHLWFVLQWWIIYLLSSNLGGFEVQVPRGNFIKTRFV